MSDALMIADAHTKAIDGFWHTFPCRECIGLQEAPYYVILCLKGVSP